MVAPSSAPPLSITAVCAAVAFSKSIVAVWGVESRAIEEILFRDVSLSHLGFEWRRWV